MCGLFASFNQLKTSFQTMEKSICNRVKKKIIMKIFISVTEKKLSAYIGFREAVEAI